MPVPLFVQGPQSVLWEMLRQPWSRQPGEVYSWEHIQVLLPAEWPWAGCLTAVHLSHHLSDACLTGQWGLSGTWRARLHLERSHQRGIAARVCNFSSLCSIYLMYQPRLIWLPDCWEGYSQNHLNSGWHNKMLGTWCLFTVTSPGLSSMCVGGENKREREIFFFLL